MYHSEMYYIIRRHASLQTQGDRLCLFKHNLTTAWAFYRQFFRKLFRWDRPLLWRGIKAVGGETYCTVGKILADIVENKMPEVSYKDIVSEHVNEAELNLIGNRRGRKRKRVRGGGNF